MNATMNRAFRWWETQAEGLPLLTADDRLSASAFELRKTLFGQEKEPQHAARI